MAFWSNWSDGKKWLMGILSALIIATIIGGVREIRQPGDRQAEKRPGETPVAPSPDPVAEQKCKEVTIPAKRFEPEPESKNVIVSADTPRRDMIRTASPSGSGPTRVTYRFSAVPCEYELKAIYASGDVLPRPVTVQLNESVVATGALAEATGGYELSNVTDVVVVGRARLKNKNKLVISTAGRPIPHILRLSFEPIDQ
jgi:hypothetical protein